MKEIIVLLFLLAFLFVIFVLPFIVSYKIAKTRKRDIAKALFVTFFFGWFGSIGMWLALKTRKGTKLL